ncbi:hypothetical protein HJFPF1_03141 [Paramyrothecium foliicola]|nr:hypothetical protein HJFPF1_03141 [Paramyrothecium foliicola]
MSSILILAYLVYKPRVPSSDQNMESDTQATVRCRLETRRPSVTLVAFPLPTQGENLLRNPCPIRHGVLEATEMEVFLPAGNFMSEHRAPAFQSFDDGQRPATWGGVAEEMTH